MSTAEARRLVNERTYGLDVIVPNIGSVAALVAALYRGDLPLLGRSIDDRIIEPLRATLIPGFAAVKDAALDAGALGCSIAGSGPSVFAFADDDDGASASARRCRRRSNRRQASTAICSGERSALKARA